MITFISPVRMNGLKTISSFLKGRGRGEKAMWHWYRKRMVSEKSCFLLLTSLCMLIFFLIVIFFLPKIHSKQKFGGWNNSTVVQWRDTTIQSTKWGQKLVALKCPQVSHLEMSTAKTFTVSRSSYMIALYYTYFAPDWTPLWPENSLTSSGHRFT